MKFTIANIRATIYDTDPHFWIRYSGLLNATTDAVWDAFKPEIVAKEVKEKAALPDAVTKGSIERIAASEVGEPKVNEPKIS